MLRASGMLAVSGKSALRAPAKRKLVLQDLRSRAGSPLRWPSRYSFTQAAAPSPKHGRIAVWFDNGPVDQHIDVWLLDVATRAFTHVPGFPIAAELKRTSLTWPPDGRLVILTSIRSHDALVVWRPGAKQAARTLLQLPPSRSPTFAAW